MAHHDGLPYEPDENSRPGQARSEPAAKIDPRELISTVRAKQAEEVAEERAQLMITLKAQQVAAEFAGELAATQSDVLDKIGATLDRLAGEPGSEDIRVDAAYQRGVAAGKAQAPPIEYPEHWGSGAIEREHLHRERMAKLHLDAARTEAYAEGYRHGREVGQPEAIVSELVTGGPSDYEVWADALHLAVKRLGNEADRRELLDCARWFHDRLKAGPPEPPVPDCLHCGADSSMDHSEGCPNAPDPVDEPLLGYQVVNPGTDEITAGLSYAEYEAHPFKGATYPRTFPGVNPDGTGTGEFSGRAGG